MNIHVEQAEGYAKFWLTPVTLAFNVGFRSGELRDLHALIEEHRSRFEEAWREHFGN
jgi:hypothetical protein